MKIKTWIFESAFAAIVLAIVVYCTGNHLVEWYGALAVWLTFNHTQITDRLAEQQKNKVKPDVPCYRKLLFYYSFKEVLWLLYFVMHRSWSALAGCIILLLYPSWRVFFRWLHPMPMVRISSPDWNSTPPPPMDTLTPESERLYKIG